jgi:hypothetical protein
MRRIFTEIEIDDNDEVFDHGGPIDYVCNRIDQIPFVETQQAVLADDDEEFDWCQYVYTLMGWCMDHCDISDEGSVPPTYQEFLQHKKED